MQVPKRKAGLHTFDKPDPHMTKEKFEQLKRKLERLKRSCPEARSEVKRLALMGDFSENAAYQIAKGRLRGLNQRILDIEEHLKKAEIINPKKNTGAVGLGNTVTLEIDGREKRFQILGSSETSPDAGVISHNSPIGSAIMGKRVGDRVIIKLAKKIIECKILKIE